MRKFCLVKSHILKAQQLEGVCMGIENSMFHSGPLSTCRSAGKGGKGGRSPPNVLQDHFSNSSNSGVKIVGGVRP